MMNKEKRLLLHSCCAPCSSACLLALTDQYRVTVYYYNPNITNRAEYDKRVAEQGRLIELYNALSGGKISAQEAFSVKAGDGISPAEVIFGPYAQKHPQLCDRILTSLTQERYPIEWIRGPYEPETFYEMAKGLEEEPERGRRCHGCYRLRLMETARRGLSEGGFDCFATTLTLSPLKDAAAINAIGRDVGLQTGLSYLESNFKKNDGYLTSLCLSQAFGLYRQSYCGCEYSQVRKE